jgi:hypothetical protein
MGELSKLSDDELRSLIGRAHAELSHRQRVRTADFKNVVRLIEEHHREQLRPLSPVPAPSHLETRK